MSIPAGPFSAWLRDTRVALKNGTGANVPCGDCTACCSSSYFIHIKPEETEALARIGKDAVTQASGLPKGHMLMGYDAEGLCPQMNQGKCAVYAHRPQTCRIYDCRIFAAAGIRESQDKPRINARVEQWSFDYPTNRDRQEHEAVQAAAAFIQAHARLFPGGKIPSSPSQLAVLALKVYQVFMEPPGEPEEVVRRIVEASRAA